MPRTKDQKRELIDVLRKDLQVQQSLVFVDVKGLNVKALSELRKRLKAVQAKIRIVKKTLLSKALGELEIPLETGDLQGQLALVFAFQDPLESIKAVFGFAKTNEHLKLLGGYLAGSSLNAQEIQKIAVIPSREELLGRLVGSITSPLSGLLRVFQGNIKGLIYVLAQAKI